MDSIERFFEKKRRQHIKKSRRARLNRTIGDFVKMCRTQRNITKTKVSLLSGVDRCVLENIEKGANSISFSTVVKLAPILDFSVEELSEAVSDHADF